MVEFGAGTVMGMLTLVLLSQGAIAFMLVTKSDLERRFDHHQESHHRDGDT